MTLPVYDCKTIQRFAAMGGIYGNIPALDACLNDAKAHQCDSLLFLGDAIGCCGHSDEAVNQLRQHFHIMIAGNHEQQAAAGLLTCGCGYASPEDERLSCMAFAYAMADLSDANRHWLGTFPDAAILNTSAGRVLLCHGSPAQTNEFLYEAELDDRRLNQWLDEFDAVGFICTHSGLPWIRPLADGRFAVNCGVVGKPDHDGDPAVHYALLTIAPGQISATIQRVEYDHLTWADTLEREGVDPIFVEPLRTGFWTTGVSSLPAQLTAPVRH
jgi:diadenosine tetraphosphatase ApaH/serine/threonine PP2A family protein phosphatase